MSLAYGLSVTGFQLKPLSQILTELQEAIDGQFGSGTWDDNPVIQYLGTILGGREADVWELLEAIYLAAFPDTAQGVDLSYAVTTTGQSRLPATASVATVVFTGTAATVIPSGFQASVQGTGAVFETAQSYTIGAGGTVSGTMSAVVTGAIAAPANSLSVIVTPVSGLTSLSNPADAAIGNATETDAQLRGRRAQDLISAIGGTATAVQNALMQVPGVSFASCLQNRTDTTDANGVPPHSIHAFVIGGLSADIASAIWTANAAGADTYGSQSATITDSEGNLQTIYWDSAADTPVYVVVQRTTDSAYPADGDAQVVSAILGYAATLGLGDSIFNWRVAAALAGIPGIDTLTIFLGTAPNPTVAYTNITIDGAHMATFSGQNISVVAG